MMNKNSNLLFEKISKILLIEWDPIGIQNISEAKDEYNAYAYTLCQEVSSKKSKVEIFEFLWWIETQHMGLAGDKDKTETIANKIHELIKDFK